MRSDLRSISTTAGLAAPNCVLIFRLSNADLRACRLSAKSLSTFGLAHGWRRYSRVMSGGGSVDVEGFVHRDRRPTVGRHVRTAKASGHAAADRCAGERRALDVGGGRLTVVGERHRNAPGPRRAVRFLAAL